MRGNNVIRTGAGAASQARKLLADRHLSVTVTEATTLLDCREPVVLEVAEADRRLGGLLVRKGEQIYYVASKFGAFDYQSRKYLKRYYIVLKRGGVWMSSSRDERANAFVIARVEAYQRIAA